MVTTSAGPKIAGYLYQFHRALFRLFSSPSSTLIGIETHDDVVAIKRLPDGSVEIEFEQDKHSVQESGHPYQDSHKNLWHTLHIWLEVVRTETTPVKPSGFCFVTNKSVSEGSLAKKLAQAVDDEAVKLCVQELRSRAKSISGKAEVSAKAVAAYSDEELAYVIQRISLLDEHGTDAGITPKEAVIESFHLPPSLAAKADDIYQSMLGMLIEICEKAWVSKHNVWVSKAQFSTRLHSEVQARLLKKVIEQPWMSLSLSQYLAQDNKNRHFLRQIRRFGAPLVTCNLAIKHYWGFYAERVRLIEEGDVLPEDWTARDSELQERWLQKLSDIELNKKPDDTDISMARNLYSAIMSSDYRAKLGRFETSHLYFTSGNYHALANDKDHECYIYWHKDFVGQVDEEGA
jgi:hypothetical protein